MTIRTKESYEHKLNIFLKDKKICKENKEIYKKFFKELEVRLKRIRGFAQLDSGCYATLYNYIIMFKNINTWFENKPLNKITTKDMEKVYEELEDGKILNRDKKPFKDRRSYYNKIFKGRFFEMIGKKKIASEVLRYGTPNAEEEVRYIEEETIRKIVDVAVKPLHKCLIWLAFDIGENINALLQLTKRDFTKLIDEDTNQPQYRINLRKETLKRSRTPRSEITNFDETTQYIDLVLKTKRKKTIKNKKGEIIEETEALLEDNDLVFPFGYMNAKQILTRAVKIIDAKCIPKGQRVTWKDLRSSMACDLLKKDWTTDEINRRLGHKPSSREINKYVNFLAIDGKKPRRKVYQHNLAKIQAELDKSVEREKIQGRRLEVLQNKMEKMEENILQSLLNKMEDKK